MQEIQYKTFSLRTHKKNWRIKKPNVCQFELTFGCGLHCRHCYTDCYNKPTLLKKELKTNDVMAILDKIYDAGVIWLCFTGGDPLARKDFLDIYSYARDKGFIQTIFTNAYSMTEEIADFLKKKPPFVIEMTLNAVTEDLYEKITQVKGSFSKAMKGIDLILKTRLPLKIKTQVTKDNLGELSKIKKFIRGVGLKFKPSPILHARLDKDVTPCELRIPPEEILSLNGKVKPDCLNDINEHNENNEFLFNCAIGGGDGIHIDPYGNMLPCICIREPKVNLLKEDIKIAHNRILSWIRMRKFSSGSECKNCSIKSICGKCAGRALLEKGDMEALVPYYCKLAKQAPYEIFNE